MSDQKQGKNAIYPDPRAMDVALFTTGAESVEITGVRMKSLMFKEHNIETNTGEKFLLVTSAGTREYGLFIRENLTTPIKQGKISEIPPASIRNDQRQNKTSFAVQLNITDLDEFLASMEISDMSDITSDVLTEKLLVPGEDTQPPTVINVKCKNITIDPGPASLSLKFVVSAEFPNQPALIEDSKMCYFENWGDDSWGPENNAEALFELLLASNANPSPDLMGFEIVDWSLEIEEPEDNTPIECSA